MGRVVNSVQALSVLYDLALTIGSEVTLDALLTRTLQRFLYHTGFPAGIVYSHAVAGGDGASVEVCLEAAVGNYDLAKRKGSRLSLPDPLVEAGAAFIEAPGPLAALPARKPYRFALRLPVEGYGGLLLLGPEAPSSPLPLTDLFLPILSRLATAISQCQRIQDRTEALERANRELEAFSYSVSHDLRAPLRAIDGFSQMLVEDYGDRLDDEGKRLLGVVRANTARMGQLIDDILSFSRMARREIEAMPIDMTRLAHEVADELKAALGNRKVHFEIGQLPAAHGDRAMIRQVFVNLLSNAVKFTQARAEALVEVGSERAGEENCYYVRDNGVGFDMQYADKLFGTFVRLHGREQFEGTGIGLAIVKRIVLRHGGHVRGKGEVDKGAIFHFCLPLDAAEAV